MTQMECNISTFTKTELQIKGTIQINDKLNINRLRIIHLRYCLKFYLRKKEKNYYNIQTIRGYLQIA